MCPCVCDKKIVASVCQEVMHRISQTLYLVAAWHNLVSIKFWWKFLSKWHHRSAFSEFLELTDLVFCCMKSQKIAKYEMTLIQFLWKEKPREHYCTAFSFFCIKHKETLFSWKFHPSNFWYFICFDMSWTRFDYF